MTPPPPPSPTTSGDTSTQARIIEAALSLFAERGYHGTNVPSVLETAGVSASSLYRLFASKEVLVNAVFRDAKARLEHALMTDLDQSVPPRELFAEFWARLARFVEEQPTAFRFLELQDHTPYLDGPSRQRELVVLAPIVFACLDFQRRGVVRADTPPDVIIATIWGAFVGLAKAARLGYLRLTPAVLNQARDACWRAFAVEAPEAPAPTPTLTRKKRTT